MAWVPKVAGNAARCYDVGDGFGYGIATAPTTPKNVWTPVQYASIVGPTFSSTPWDPSNGTLVPQHAVEDASTWWVSGSSSAADATLVFVLAYYDSLGSVMGITPSYTVLTNSTYSVVSTSRYPLTGVLIWDSFQAANYFGLIVASISTGSWTLQFNLL